MGSKLQPPLLPMETPPTPPQHNLECDNNDATNKLTGSMCLIEQKSREDVGSPIVCTHNPTPTGDQGTTVNYSNVGGDETVDQAAKQISESEATGYHDHLRTESPELAGLFTISDDLIDDTAGLSEPVIKVELDNREDSACLVSEFDSGAVLGSKEESSCHPVRQTSTEETELVNEKDMHVLSALKGEEDSKILCAGGVSEKILTAEVGAGEIGEEGGSGEQEGGERESEEGGDGEGGGEEGGGGGEGGGKEGGGGGEGGGGEGGGEEGGGGADGRAEMGDQDEATSGSSSIVPGTAETTNGKKLSLSYLFMVNR